jgi:cob(I)alamin adenosyltransferase
MEKKNIQTSADITRELLYRFPWILQEIRELQQELILLQDNRSLIQSSRLKDAVVQCEQINRLELEVVQTEKDQEKIRERINHLYNFRREVWQIYFKMPAIKKAIVKSKYFEVDIRNTNKDIARKIERSVLTLKNINTEIVKEFRSINKYKNIL